MSLLLDALKRAEQQKREGSNPATDVRRAPPAGRIELALEELSTPGPREIPAATRAPAPAPADSPFAAEKLFTAKGNRSISRNLVMLAVAVLLLLAGGSFYVWRESSGPTLATFPTQPPRQSGAVSPPPRPAAPPTAAPTAPAVTPVVASAASAAPGAPATPPASALPQAAPAAPAPAAGPAALPAAAEERPQRTTAIKIQRAEIQPEVNPALASAYRALVAGDLEAAQTGYRDMLQTDPLSRDTLLGLAAIALKRNQPQQAAAYYERVLELNPKDAMGIAGMVALQKQLDPAAAESRLKTVLAGQPDAAVLYFALGNQYAGRARWAEAQRAYFQAYQSETANADFAFNLAVSLDQLGQSRLAGEYYRRALTLSEQGPSGFDRTQALNRIRELEQ